MTIAKNNIRKKLTYYSQLFQILKKFRFLSLKIWF